VFLVVRFFAEAWQQVAGHNAGWRNYHKYFFSRNPLRSVFAFTLTVTQV
jgi:hypothetical protein